MKTPAVPIKDIYVCWVDDIKGFVPSYQGKFDILQNDHPVKFVVDEHNDTKDFDTIARAINDDGSLVFFIDYNLKGSDGNGVDGDALIKMIRKHGKKCPIVFYSSNATQEELRALVNGIPLVICVLRESLNDILTELANGEFSNRFK